MIPQKSSELEPPENLTLPSRKPLILLHTCCGPCAAHVIDLLLEQYQPTCFFYNPNIHPEEEFVARLAAVTRVCRGARVPLWVPAYRPADWYAAVRGREGDPEGGGRCDICFRQRLAVTMKAASGAAIPFATTTLTISPRKKSHTINNIGVELSAAYGVTFLSRDFKKKDGFCKSVEKSRQLGLYRQGFCGCVFSKRSTEQGV